MGDLDWDHEDHPRERRPLLPQGLGYERGGSSGRVSPGTLERDSMGPGVYGRLGSGTNPYPWDPRGLLQG